ncbi:MAG: YihY family inner membrane protein [Burkholderiales bacterium]|uniref:YihY family inner membrane protein n=1 Tax=Ottowia sp. TaxID=1898956 RepID=UPI001AC3D7B5|nr:YihY family inner membrane protein [Ottowia sp.]MBN9403918.1 YihY family inner membrane protein [Burkholderiales bacterium]MBS0404474.1 YihY family inner membrane protein [Pseudomonadota bacterium]MBS0414875.1 YihY family inner membrane protein [Pseudomonadota bacterium]
MPGSRQGLGLGARLQRVAAQVADFPLYPTLLTLWQRLLQDRLGLTASSLTFTTVLALVPLFAVVLSVFTAFPAFAHLQGALQQWLAGNLIPPGIAANVTDYLVQFAGKASQLGAAGFAGLVVTAVSLLLTIDKTFNQIWRASSRRPLGQRVLVYWAALTLGPLVLAASLAITSYLATASRGWLPHGSGGVNTALALLQFLLSTGALMALYRYVPNTPVRWRHAAVGALFVTVCLGLARQALGWYLTRVPTYSVIYGTFATVPILLLWIYLGWLIVLWGAVIAAYLPSLLGGPVRRASGPGWEFQLACEALRALAQARDAAPHGLALPELARRLRVDPLVLHPVLDTLRALGWTGLLAPADDSTPPRHVLLADAASTPLAPLMDRLLLAPDAQAGWRQGDKPWRALTLADVVGE